jgi:hypothetical protein
MARTVEDIKSQITSSFIADPVIKDTYGLVDGQGFDARFSKASIESILFYDVAFVHRQLENLFDAHKKEVFDWISRMKPHGAQWYAEKARAFQDRFDLLPGSDLFNNSEHTEEEIEVSKIIKYSAITEQDNKLLIKVAKRENDDLSKLSQEELSRFEYYINRIKDAGVKIEVMTGDPEILYLDLTIYYNPLIITSTGARLDGTEEDVVKNAIKRYLSGIEFDGTLVVASLVDALQAVEGVRIPHVNSISYSYGALAAIPISVYHRPHTGYIRLYNDELSIHYIPR